MKRVLFSAFLSAIILDVIVSVANAQQIPVNVNLVDKPQMMRHSERREFRLPNIMGYKTLKGDFHLHTVFSDGHVWPTIRVEEAWRDGLDMIAITDHIEYRNKLDYLKSDHNTPYKIAEPRAREMGITLIQATELTHWDKVRGGHINALFITDANKLVRQDPESSLQQAVDSAVAQGAFLIWNHPGWAIDSCRYYPLNAEWVAQGKIKAVELFNEKEYYPRAATWCKEKKLAPVAASDAHLPLFDLYVESVRRPFTAVLAKENTQESIKEALFAGRTIAIFDDQAVGTEELLGALFHASVSIGRLSNGAYTITNNSDLPFVIRSKELNTTLMPNNTQQFRLSKDKTDIQIEVQNLHVTEDTNLNTTIKPLI